MYGDALWTCAIEGGDEAVADVIAQELDLRADGSAFTLVCVLGVRWRGG